MFDRATRIAVAGAGSIGCYAGGCLALAGRKVTLLARPRIVEAVGQTGLTIVDLDGSERKLAPSALAASADPAEAFAGAGLVLVTVKSGDTAEMAEAHCPPCAAGRYGRQPAERHRQCDALRQLLPATQRVVAGMVPFKWCRTKQPDGRVAFRRTTSGEIHVEAEVPGLVDLLNVEGFQVGARRRYDSRAVGQAHPQSRQRDQRAVRLAARRATRRPALAVAVRRADGRGAGGDARAGIKPVAIGPLRPALLPYVLRLPDFLFRLLAGRMVAVDPRRDPRPCRTSTVGAAPRRTNSRAPSCALPN